MVLDLCIDVHCKATYRIVQPPEQWYVGSGGYTCKPAFMSIDVPRPYGPAIFITGEIFMRTFYTIFDRGSEEGRRSRVCIAKNKSQTELTEEVLRQTTELAGYKVVRGPSEVRHKKDEPYGDDGNNNGS